MVIFIAGILSIPKEFFEAARLEGGTWVKFRHVIIPMARNATSTCASSRAPEKELVKEASTGC
jgi:ABC-type sugar transport system permease subunit